MFKGSEIPTGSSSPYYIRSSNCTVLNEAIVRIINPVTALYCNNESTTGADASVEVPKLHNIKLLIATHIDFNYHDEHL